MSRRSSIILLLWISYFAALILVDAVIPLIDPSDSGIISYLPFFFFIPIFFPGRYRRRNRNQNRTTNGSSTSTNQDSAKEKTDYIINDYDINNLEQYGISYRRRNYSLLYIAGIVIIVAGILIALYYSGTI